MTKTLLNGYKMNDAIRMLKEATQKDENSHFAVKCENCTISILAEAMLGHNRGTIEVALRSVDDSAWIPLEMDGYTEDRPIIRELPLTCFVAFITQFKSLKQEDFSEVWNAWDTISCYM